MSSHNQVHFKVDDEVICLFVFLVHFEFHFVLHVKVHLGFHIEFILDFLYIDNYSHCTTVYVYTWIFMIFYDSLFVLEVM